MSNTMMDTKYLTVVFEINDKEDFKDLHAQFHEKMLASSTEPWRVTGMAQGDEMTKIELIEAAVAELDDEYEIKHVVENISSTPLESLEGKTIEDFF